MATFLKKLHSCLACPVTGGAIEIIPTSILPDGDVLDGWVLSTQTGRCVGQIRNFQLDMVRPDRTDSLEDLRGAEPKVVSVRPKSRLVNPQDAMFKYDGSWNLIEPGLYCSEGTNGPGAVYFDVGPRFDILFDAHPWSGSVFIRIGEDAPTQHNLYNAHLAVPHIISFDLRDRLQPGETIKVRLVQGGKMSVSSFGEQVLFAGLRIYSEEAEPFVWSKPELRKPPHFPSEFWAALDATPHDGIILDYGGGSRQIPDHRYVNLDYAALSAPDIVGDGLNLPFRDNSIDVVFTSGVMEHLTDPLRGGREIARVLKPGGFVLADVAFMQPVHSEGQHFFNATIWGIQEIFKDLELEKAWAAGSFAWMVEWLLETAGIRDRIAPELFFSFKKQLEDFETLIPEDRLLYVAPSVWLKGWKR